MGRIKNIWNPDNFQGKHEKKEYFEGWYFKLVDKEEENFLAIIPGISIKDDGSSHSFIQVNDGNNNKAYYIEYLYKDFTYEEDKFIVKIGGNLFSKDKLILDIDTNDLKLKGKLEFKNNVEWPVKLLSPGAMGWFRFMPFMECYHGVVSMNHDIYGNININSKTINFDKGKGYIEKDWGTSFPKTWIWAQSNHFSKENNSIFISIANIPFIGREFNGFLMGLLHEGKLYRFTTYTGSKINKLKYMDDSIEFTVSDSKYSLHVKIIKHNTTRLISPKNGNMNGTVEESLTSSIEIELKNKKNNTIIFKDIGRNSGFEVKGRLI
ncbi:tocopherol cyclase family protein [Senegalia sp. (in: firmicutes)]|uniref:tocopherol cyclase family protein n=1 Tax=Senegalia sp. (in: firmicutes) TaxID=1924098 RepID=UPI003F9C207C